MTESSPNVPAEIEAMLRNSKTIAVVGMSDKPNRASYNIGSYLMDEGYRVFPVNPVLTEVKGMKCFATLAEAQAACRELTGQGIDLVDVFRASEHVPAIVDEVIHLGIPNLWLQDGVEDEEAISRARAAGVTCVQNDCIFRRHAALPMSED